MFWWCSPNGQFLPCCLNQIQVASARFPGRLPRCSNLQAGTNCLILRSRVGWGGPHACAGHMLVDHVTWNSTSESFHCQQAAVAKSRYVFRCPSSTQTLKIINKSSTSLVRLHSFDALKEEFWMSFMRSAKGPTRSFGQACLRRVSLRTSSCVQRYR